MIVNGDANFETPVRWKELKGGRGKWLVFAPTLINNRGTLRHAGGRLVLTGEQGREFDVPLSEVQAKYRWFYFGQCFGVSAGGKTYLIGFVAPPGGEPAGGLSTCKQWRDVLAPQMH